MRPIPETDSMASTINASLIYGEDKLTEEDDIVAVYGAVGGGLKGPIDWGDEMKAEGQTEIG